MADFVCEHTPRRDGCPDLLSIRLVVLGLTILYSRIPDDLARAALRKACCPTVRRECRIDNYCQEVSLVELPSLDYVIPGARLR